MLLTPQTTLKYTVSFSTFTCCSPLTLPNNTQLYSSLLLFAHTTQSPTIHSSIQYRYILLTPHNPQQYTVLFSTVTFCSHLTLHHNTNFHSVPLFFAHPSNPLIIHSSIQYRYMLLNLHTPPQYIFPFGTVTYCSPQTLPNNTNFHSVPLHVAHPYTPNNTEFYSVPLHVAHTSNSPTLHSSIQYRYMFLTPHTPPKFKFPFCTVTCFSPITLPHNINFHSIQLHVAHPSQSSTIHSSIQYR
jgi:hypothetical protein